MAKDNVFESVDSDEFSEVHSIISNDSEIPQPPLRTPKTSKTRRAPKTPKATQDGLKRFWHEGDEFIEAESIAKSVGAAKRKKTSPIWKLGREVKRVKDKKAFWRCSICKKIGVTTIMVSGATSGPVRHLESHGYGKHDGRLVHIQKNKKASQSANTQSEATGSNTYLSATTADQFRALLLQWIICSHIALSMVENPLFRKLIEFVNLLFISLLPKSASTIRQWVIDEHKRQKAQKMEILRKARSRITISFDTWTSPFSRKHILSVIGHYVDENWERRHLQLSILRLYGGHSGENLAHHMIPILQEWGIDSHLGYVITDNEPANGTAVDYILEAVEPEAYISIKSKKAKRAELRKRWIRCFAHSLNLISQAFLFGQKPEDFLMKTDGAELTGDLNSLNELWRTRGFIGKVANIVRYIRRSPKQRAEFERIRVNDDGDDVYWIAVEEVEADEQLELIANNQTRWNSTYDMLIRALKLKVRFQAYCENWKSPNRDDDDDYNLWDDKLSPEEWHGVEKVVAVLAPLKKITKQLERRDKCLRHTIPYYDWVLSHLYNASQDFKQQSNKTNNQDAIFQWLYLCAEAAWTKANQLYKKIDDSPAYYTALVLDPQSKFQWFEQRWGMDREKRKWLQGMKEVVNNHWQSYRSQQPPQDPCSAYQHDPKSSLADSNSDHDDTCDSLGIEQYLRLSHDSIPKKQSSDVFNEYTSSPPVPRFELTQWQHEHPDLVQFALDHAAVPISTSECERSFSSAKFALNPLRSRMKSDLFEALETLRAWYLDDQARKQKADSRQADQKERQIIIEAL